MVKKYEKEIEADATLVSFGMSSGSIYIPMFDTMKEIMWRSELNVERVYRRHDRKRGN